MSPDPRVAVPTHVQPPVSPLPPPHPADEIMFESRLRAYDALWSDLGVVPFGERRLLDAGCGNGKFLDICCRRWGAREANCVGTDRRGDVWAAWHAAHPGTAITFVQQPAHDPAFPAASFDVVHQSMLLSSVIEPQVRTATAEALWQALRPGGLLVSYDFWLNPTNPRASGIRASTLQRLFPEGRLRYRRSLTFAPPLCRPLLFLGAPALRGLESLRALNTHLLIAMEKPAPSRA
jgi:SAM-dependent methyltransferase